MKKDGKKNSVTIDDLAVMVAKGFDHVENKMDVRFQAVDKRFDGIDKRLDDIDYRLGKIESNHERRLDILEDRMAVVKTYFEKNFKVKF